MARLRVELTDPAMGSGVATHYFTGLTADAQQAVKDFWSACASHMAGYVNIKVPNVADVLDETDGTLLNTTVQGTEGNFVGGGTGAYPGGVGACINWTTAGIVAGKRVRGRTFVVPLAASVFDTDGTLSSATVGALSTAAADLITDVGSELVIWSRPRVGLDGSVHPVVAGSCADRVAWLQSRKS